MAPVLSKEAISDNKVVWFFVFVFCFCFVLLCLFVCLFVCFVGGGGGGLCFIFSSVLFEDQERCLASFQRYLSRYSLAAERLSMDGFYRTTSAVFYFKNIVSILDKRHFLYKLSAKELASPSFWVKFAGGNKVAFHWSRKKKKRQRPLAISRDTRTIFAFLDFHKCFNFSRKRKTQSSKFRPHKFRWQSRIDGSAALH